MTDLKLELKVIVTGDSLFEMEDKLTQFVGDRIKARMMANPTQAINAQRGPCPDMPQGLNIKPLKDIPPVVNEAVNKHRKNNFEEA